MQDLGALKLALQVGGLDVERARRRLHDEGRTTGPFSFSQSSSSFSDGSSDGKSVQPKVRFVRSPGASVAANAERMGMSEFMVRAAHHDSTPEVPAVAPARQWSGRA